MTPAEITQLVDAMKQLGVGLGAIATAIVTLVSLMKSIEANRRLDKHGQQIDEINRMMPSPLQTPTNTVNVDTEPK